MSNHQLSKPERSVLEKGLNFAVTPQKDRAIIDEFVICMERAASVVPQTQANDFRSEAVNILKSQKAPHPNIAMDEQQAIKDLSKNKDRVLRKNDNYAE